MIPTYFFAPIDHLLATQAINRFVATLLLIITSTECSADEVGDELFSECYSVIGVDFAFDGGSIGFDLKDSKEGKSRLLFVHPKSHLREKYPESKCLWSILNLSDTKPIVVDASLAMKLFVSIVSTDQKDDNLKEACLAILLAYAADVRIELWSNEAVEAIKKGDWDLLFKKQVEHELDSKDPFDF